MNKKRIGLVLVSLVLGYVGFNMFMRFMIDEQFGDDAESAPNANIMIRIYLFSPLLATIIGSGMLGWVIMSIIGDMFDSNKVSETEN
jgi:hypothetical protein